NWSDNHDRIYLASSADGRGFNPARQVLDDTGLFEVWHPRLVVRGDGTWLLYTNIKYTSSENFPSVALATSVDGGNTFQWVLDPNTGLPLKIIGGYRWGSVTSQPGGPFIQFATSNADNTLNQFTSTDGVTWSGPTSLGVWGVDAI